MPLRGSATRSRTATKDEETLRSRNILTEHGRPNSRDREQQRLRKTHEPEMSAQKRQLQLTAPSPMTKENSVDSGSPAPKRRRAPDQDDSPAIFFRNGSKNSLNRSPKGDKESGSAGFSQSTLPLQGSPDGLGEDIDTEISEENTEVIFSTGKVPRHRRNLKEELHKSARLSQGSTQSKPRGRPRPHKALAYYQERMKGNVVEPSSGVVKRVRLFNFMCHERFEKDWNPNLNFITGENGSGKSAILSGIIVGLGARANVTSRTKSISELVKSGTDFARTQITLVNNGNLSDEKYGKEVTIQRDIDARGPSKYKICTGLSPRFKDLRRHELDYILCNLGIMIDNPVAVLNQEAARSFLKTQDPKDKYKFFFEGSSLGQFDRILSETKMNMDTTERNLKMTKDIVEDHHEEVKKYRGMQARLDEAESMEEQIDLLSIEYHWALVVVEETKRDEAKTELERTETLRSKLSGGLDVLKGRKDEMIASSSTSPEEIELMKDKLRQMGREDQDIQREISQLNRQSNENRAKLRSSAGQISSVRRTLIDLEAKVHDMSTRGKEEAETARLEYEEKLSALQADKDEYEGGYQTLKNERQQFSHGTETLRNELSDLEGRGKDLRQRIVRLKDELKNLQGKNSSMNRYTAFGRSMEDLVAKIQANQHRFKVTPRGPLGACFTVKNEKWVRLIEMILNGRLYDFVVENTDDQHILNQLIDQCFSPRGRQSGLNDSIGERGSGRRPTVIFNRAAFRSAFDTSHKTATTASHPTILDVIEIENGDTAIFNTLIDSCAVEKILLFETNQAACNLLKDRHHPEFPKNCRVGFTLEYFQIQPDPKYRIEVKNNRHPNTYLKCSSVVQQKYLSSCILEAQANLEELLPELEAKKREEAIVRTEFLNQDEALRNLQKKLTEIKMRIMTHSKTITKEPDISSFVEEMHETRHQLELHEKVKDEAEERLNTIKVKLAELKTRKDELTVDIESIQTNVSEKKDVADNFREKLTQLENKIRSAKLKLREVEGQCDIIKPKLELMEQSVEGRINEAQEVGERVETDRSPASLQAEVKQFAERVKESKRLLGDPETIMTNLSKAKEKHRRLKLEYRCWYEIFLLMQSYANSNIDYYESTIQIIGNVLITSFQCLIGSRGYKGRLLIDHEHKELYYFVCPDGKANEKMLNVLNCKDSRTIKHYLIEYANGLSGGERSFATICYILSMWQIMECPFFMLDEFDVFMDELNRKASQNALISHANRFKSHQFFLFTPLDITELEQNSTASVTKMFPPLRQPSGSGIANDTQQQDSDGESSPGGKRHRGQPDEPVAGTSKQKGRRGRKNL